MDHEAAFTDAFIASGKRARFVQQLADPKRRKDMLECLDRDLPCMPGFGTEVPRGQDFPDGLEALLRSKGAGPTCRVIAKGLKADRRDLPLREALQLVCLSEFGAILSCIPGRLAYYKPEAPLPGILFERRPEGSPGV
jgi:hypothetical protein